MTTLDTTKAPAATVADTDGPDPKRWLALGVIALAQLMVVLDASIVNIALPSAQRDLHIATLSDAQWVITAYTLAFGGLLLLGGRIADFVGRKRTFLVGLIGFAAASGLGGAAVNAPMLYSSRALQGAFAALLAPAALSLISTTFTEAKERATAFGVYGAIAGGGAAIGLILGGVLTEYASWRWCLLVNIPIALGAAAAALPLVRESAAQGNRKYDIPGAVLATAGLVALVYGFTEASKAGVGWAAGRTVALLVAAVALLVAFVVRETRTASPLLPLRVPLDRNRGGSYLASLLVGGGLFSMFLFLTYYFQRNLGYSPLRSGFAFLPFSGGIIVTAGVVSQILPRTGPKPLMALGMGMAAVGLLSLTQITQGSAWVTYVLPAELLMSIGMGLVFVPLSSTALLGVGNHDAGVASALLNTSQQVGGSLGTALLSTLYTGSVTSWMTSHHAVAVKTPFGLQPQPDALIAGYHTAFTIGAGMLGIAFVVILVLIRAKKDDVPAEGGVPAVV